MALIPLKLSGISISIIPCTASNGRSVLRLMSLMLGREDTVRYLGYKEGIIDHQEVNLSIFVRNFRVECAF